MKIIYYGRDSGAAEALAAEIRESKIAAQVRHAPFFDQPEKADDVIILDCVSDNDRARIAAAYQIAEAKPTEPTELGTDSGDQFSDEQLRAVIEDATGKAPHPKTGRAKLIAQFNALNAAE
jgi:hypothetical protein